MSWLNFIGYRKFKPESDIKQIVLEDISKSSKLNSELTKNNLNALLIFATSTQQTWLISTPVGLYCLLDDVQEDTDENIIRWKTDLKRMFEILEQLRIEPEVINLKNSGLIHLARNHNRWLYSKKLFPKRIYLENKVKNLISHY